MALHAYNAFKKVVFPVGDKRYSFEVRIQRFEQTDDFITGDPVLDDAARKGIMCLARELGCEDELIEHLKEWVRDSYATLHKRKQDPDYKMAELDEHDAKLVVDFLSAAVGKDQAAEFAHSVRLPLGLSD